MVDGLSLLWYYPRSIYLADVVIGDKYVDMVFFNPTDYARSVEMYTDLIVSKAVAYDARNPEGYSPVQQKPNSVSFTIGRWSIVRLKLEFKPVPRNLIRFKHLLRRRGVI